MSIAKEVKILVENEPKWGSPEWKEASLARQREQARKAAEYRQSLRDNPPPKSDYGYANSWGGKTPAAIQKCHDAGHKLTVTKEGNCLTKYECPTCKHHYRVDSGD